MTPLSSRVGDVLRLNRTRIDPHETEEYRQIGVYSWGKGIIENQSKPGRDLSKVTYYEFPTGSLILSNIQAWESAIAVADDRHSEFIASQRFLPYTPIDPEVIDVRFACHYFLSENGIAQIKKASPGSITRNRTLGITAFENLHIPLPKIEVQRAIASRLDAVVENSNRVAASGSELERLLDIQEATVIEEALERGVAMMPSLAEINPPPARIQGDELVHFVPMSDVDHITGAIVGQQVIARSELGLGYKQFRRGDIIFARITPSMQNGKSAVFVGALASTGYGSTEFHVVRSHEAQHTEALHTILRTKWFRDRAMKSFTGTAGQQRVPASHLKSAVIPDISRSSARPLVQKLREVDSARREAKQLFNHRFTVAKALPQAARNAEFERLMS